MILRQIKLVRMYAGSRRIGNRPTCPFVLYYCVRFKGFRDTWIEFGNRPDRAAALPYFQNALFAKVVETSNYIK